ncbi:hypothetical protein ACRRTK_024052 [Alexandromys fortis]
MAPCDLGTDWVGVCSVCYSALKDPSPVLTFPTAGKKLLPALFKQLQHQWVVRSRAWSS